MPGAPPPPDEDGAAPAPATRRARAQARAAAAPAASSKLGTYGALGLAAALLLGLFFVSRIIVATSVVNATLWDRRARAAPVPTPTAPR